MSISKLSLAFIAISCISPASAAYFYPNVIASLLEHEFVDAHGSHRAGFIDAITPCTNYVSGAVTVGRQTAAQWVRVSFHDFVTHHTSDGSGGLDASIGFESDRAENVGAAMNDTMRFFRNRVNSKIGAADFLALSVSTAIGNCGGPVIPVKYGRKDATGPGPTGVPTPETSLSDTLAMFSGAGISQTEAIGLVACGHTFGGVHVGVFPNVVPASAITPTNTAGGVDFDSTPGVFDNDVIHAYIDGTGARGGPLVTTPNVTSQSDTRLYTSDNNATMKGFYALSNAGFVSHCTTVFQQMIETVPNGVTLSSAVTPMLVKPINATLDYNSAGKLIFTGYIRTLDTTVALGKRDTPSVTLKIPVNATTANFAAKAAATTTLVPERGGGSSIYGTTTFYPFSQTVPDPTVMTSFQVTTDKTYTFATQYQAFVIPSSVKVTGAINAAVTVKFQIAQYGTTANPSVTVAVPVSQPNTQSPKIVTFPQVAMTLTSTDSAGNYAIFTGSVTTSVWTAGAISISILTSRGAELDVLMVDGKLK